MIWIIDNIQWLGGLVVAFFTYLVGRKSTKNNEESQELENLKTVRELEKELIKDIEANIEQYKKWLKESKDYIFKLEKLLAGKNKKIDELEKLKITK